MIPPEVREAVENRSGGRCERPYCLAYATEIAHLRGVGMGGSSDPDTHDPRHLMHLCKTCHDLLDGRSHAGLRRFMGDLLIEINDLRSYVTTLLAKVRSEE